MKGLSERAGPGTLAVKSQSNPKPIHDLTTTAQAPAQGNPRIYRLKPDLRFPPRILAVPPHQPDRAVRDLVNAIAPPPPKRAPLPTTPRDLPPRQPLPTAVLDPARPLLKLGRDVHLEFIMAVVQKDHANPPAPRKFTNDELVAQMTCCPSATHFVTCATSSSLVNLRGAFGLA